jgi:hypothetical protein
MRIEKIGNATLILGDSQEVLANIDKVDSVVCDPPYGISFMGKGWDHQVPQSDHWTAINGAMKDGAHLLSFFGSRTYHRGACAIEDAGFEIRDQIMWLFATGFPKNHDISKAIDKAAGHWRGKAGAIHEGDEKRAFGQHYERTDKGDPITDAAKLWQGWGTALKPAHEPITVARKPFSGTVAANVLSNGTGALNIDGCRVPTTDGYETRFVSQTVGSQGAVYNTRFEDRIFQPAAGGRYPANLIHDGSDELPFMKYFYCPKVSRKERGEGNNHPTLKPIALMAYLCKLVTPAGGTVLDPFMGSGSTGLAALSEGFNFIGIERDPDYFEIALKRFRDDA